jgi:hypothetical protein
MSRSGRFVGRCPVAPLHRKLSMETLRKALIFFLSLAGASPLLARNYSIADFKSEIILH